MDYSSQATKTLIIKENKIIRQVLIKDITHIISNSYLCRLHLNNEKNHFTCCKYLKEFEEELENYGFLRINHNIIINAKYFDYIKMGTKRIVVLSNNLEFIVSRGRWPIVKEKLFLS